MALFGKQLSMGVSEPVARHTRVAIFESDDSGAPAQTSTRREFDFNNVLLLIPGEVIAPFITAVGLPVESVFGISWRHVVFFTCLGACVLLRGQASKPVGAAPGLTGVNWRLVAVSAFAFFLWAQAVDDHGPLVDRSAFHGLPANMSPTAIWGFFAVIFGMLAPKAVQPSPMAAAAHKADH